MNDNINNWLARLSIMKVSTIVDISPKEAGELHAAVQALVNESIELERSLKVVEKTLLDTEQARTNLEERVAQLSVTPRRARK